MVILNEQGQIEASSSEELPIEDFFGSLTDTYFLKDIAYLLQGIGLGKEVLSCNFPDPTEEGRDFEGVKFVLDINWDDARDEIVVPVEEFHRILRLACRGYLRRHPGDESKLRATFAKAGVAFDG